MGVSALMVTSFHPSHSAKQEIHPISGKFFQPEIALTIEILQMSQPGNAWWADQWNH